LKLFGFKIYWTIQERFSCQQNQGSFLPVWKRIAGILSRPDRFFDFPTVRRADSHLEPDIPYIIGLLHHQSRFGARKPLNPKARSLHSSLRQKRKKKSPIPKPYKCANYNKEKVKKIEF
jgi:hypothetical protein